MRMPCSASAGRSVAAKQCGLAVAELDRALADRVDRLARACGRRGQRLVEPGVDLVVQAGDADHEELVEVGGEDRAELDALEQRHARVLGELQHAIVEVAARRARG